MLVVIFLETESTTVWPCMTCVKPVKSQIYVPVEKNLYFYVFSIGTSMNLNSLYPWELAFSIDGNATNFTWYALEI